MGKQQDLSATCDPAAYAQAILGRSLFVPHPAGLSLPLSIDDLAALLDAARSEGPLPVGGEGDHQALMTRLDTIRRTADHWREYDAANRAAEGLTTTDDSHIIAPPCWPTHGMLKVWSETLALAMDRVTTPHHRAALYSQRRSK